MLFLPCMVFKQLYELSLVDIRFDGGNTFAAVLQQFTRSIDKMIVYGMAGIVLTLLTAICSFVLIPLEGVLGYVLSLILANLFTGVYSFYFREVTNIVHWLV